MMKTIVKIATILLILIVLGVLGLAGIKSYQKNTEIAGILKVSVSPSNTTVLVNGKIYKNSNGLLAVKLSANRYKINFSYPGYSVVEKEIEIKPQQVLDLGKIYLFPVSWPKEEIVAADAIERFYANQGMNYLVFFQKIDKNIEWIFYNRSAKESQKFYQTTSLPQALIFSPDAKKIITMIKDNEWKVVFLPKSLLDRDINLNNEFALGLKRANLQAPKSVVIRQIAFISKEASDDLLVRTDQGLYRFNYLERQATQIIDALISPFILENDDLYFIKNNGSLTRLNLTDLSEEQLFLASLKDGDEDLNKIIIKKIAGKNAFLAIKEGGRALLLDGKTGVPPILGESVADGYFSFTGNRLLLFTQEGKIILYDLNLVAKDEQGFLADAPPQWFLDDNCFLFSNGSQLKIYNLETKETWPVINDLKRGNFIYDAALDYIFYLSDAGIERISL